MIFFGVLFSFVSNYTINDNKADYEEYQEEDYPGMEIGPMDAYELMDKYKRAKNNYFDLENIEYDSDDTLVFEYEYPFSIELANTYEKKWSSDTFRCVNLELKDHFIDAICAEANNYYYPEDFVVAKKKE